MIPVVVHMWMELDSERSNFLFYITRNKKKTWKTQKFKTTSDSLPYHTLSAVCWTTQGETRKTGLWKITAFRRTSAAEFPGDGLHCSTDTQAFSKPFPASPYIYVQGHYRTELQYHSWSINQK